MILVFIWHLLRVLVTGLIAALVLAVIMMLTPQGGHWLLRNALRLAPPGFTVERIEGSVFGGFKLEGVRYTADNLTLNVHSMELLWSPLALLRGIANIDALRAEGVFLKLPTTSSPSDQTREHALPSLPIAIVLGQLVIEDTVIQRGDTRVAVNALHVAMRIENGKVDLGALDIESPQGNFSAAGSLGLISPYPLQVTSSWQNLRWPPQESDTIESPEGTISITGTLENYHLETHTRARAKQLADSALSLSASGNAKEVHVENLTVSILGGELKADGHIGISPTISWDLDLNGRNIDPGKANPDYPGQIAFHARSTGRIEAGGPVFSAKVDHLAGTLRGRPVSLETSIDGNSQDYRLQVLELAFGSNHVSASGTLGHTLDLGVKLDISDAAALLPDAKGKLKGSAKFSGPLPLPSAQGQLGATELAFRDYSIKNLNLDFKLDPTDTASSTTHLSAVGLSFSGQTINAADITLNGKTKAHRLQARISSSLGELSAALSGRYAANRWNGRLEQFDLVHTQAGDWRLERPTALSVSASEFTLADNCLVSADAHLCASGSSLKSSGLSGQAQIKNLPLSLAKPWLPTDMNIIGTVSATANFRQAPASVPVGAAQVTLSPGSVSYKAENPSSARYDWTSVDLKLDAKDQDAKLHFALRGPGTDTAQADLHLLGYQTSDPSLDGSVNAQLQLPPWISAFTPDIDWKQGARLQMQANVGGRRSAPTVRGDASFNAAKLGIPRLGVELQDIRVQAQSQGTESVTLSADARSGPGNLHAAGLVKLDPEAGWPTNITVKGQNFELAKLPEITLRASPDLHFAGTASAADLEGKIRLDTLKIEIKQLPKTAISVSDDQRIVGASEPAPPSLLAGLRTQVQVDIPDESTLKGFGLDTHMKGRVAIRQEPGGIAAVQGQLDLKDGMYEAFGQKLSIKRGRFIFSGPADNPGLDIQAERDAGDVTAGIQVSGTLKLPITNVYSQPSLPEDEALAYLLLGKPLSGASSGEGDLLSSAALALGTRGANPLAKRLGGAIGLDELSIEGQGGVALGKQISSRLSLRYVYGLFDRVGSVLLQYKLTKSLSLEAHTGVAQTVNLLYKVERN